MPIASARARMLPPHRGFATSQRHDREGGPGRIRALKSNGDTREVISDAHARYFGAEFDDESPVASPGARIGSKRFEDWLQEARK